jgi:triosephosphate isomerase
MRPIVIAANWKMNTTPADAGPLAALIASRTNDPDVVRVICPPFVCLAAVRDALAGTTVAVGAQNIHQELAGAFTGEVSAPMLAGLATWVILGHSERRREFGETDELISQKLARAVDAGLRPILCVGEQLDDREAGRQNEIVEAQMWGCLKSHGEGLIEAGLVIAYEPVWAIGTGRSATPADASAMSAVIARTLDETRLDAGRNASQSVPILYGGSVTSANFGDFMTEPGIDGALVGGASLKPDEMAGIVARAGVTARARREAAG